MDFDGFQMNKYTRRESVFKRNSICNLNAAKHQVANQQYPTNQKNIRKTSWIF